MGQQFQRNISKNVGGNKYVSVDFVSPLFSLPSSTGKRACVRALHATLQVSLSLSFFLSLHHHACLPCTRGQGGSCVLSFLPFRSCSRDQKFISASAAAAAAAVTRASLHREAIVCASLRSGLLRCITSLASVFLHHTHTHNTDRQTSHRMSQDTLWRCACVRAFSRVRASLIE